MDQSSTTESPGDAGAEPPPMTPPQNPTPASDAAVADAGSASDAASSMSDAGLSMDAHLPGHDAGMTMDASMPPADAGAPMDAGAPACIAPVAPPGSGHHNPGRDCSQCHNFTVAGTLFTQLTGGTGIAGATIEVIDANNQRLLLPTYQNGNFYTQQAVAYPIRLRASRCPNDAPMISTAATGTCNGCHNSTFQAHLP
jgi:hypothetical protein